MDGRLVVEPGQKTSVELHDSADHRLRRQGVTLSALGTFACDFPLPAGMPEGGYSIVASDDAGHHRTALFEIEAPPVESERLEIVLPRKVYYRGETIEGTVRAILPEDRRLVGAKWSIASAASRQPLPRPTPAAKPVFPSPPASLSNTAMLPMTAVPAQGLAAVRRHDCYSRLLDRPFDRSAGFRRG